MKNAEYESHDYLFPDIHNSLSFVKSCTLCYQPHNFKGQDIIWGNGPGNAKIIFVGKDSAGGETSERLWKGSRYTLMPLTNKKSGAKIRILLNKMGINPHDLFFTNTVKCNKGYDKLGLSYDNLVPFCTQHLLEEIKLIKPDKIICLGRIPHKIVCEMVEKYNAGLKKENCIYLEHPSHVEGIKRESEYINRLRQII